MQNFKSFSLTTLENFFNKLECYRANDKNTENFIQCNHHNVKNKTRSSYQSILAFQKIFAKRVSHRKCFTIIFCIFFVDIQTFGYRWSTGLYFDQVKIQS